jgi:hypothetical protein
LPVAVTCGVFAVYFLVEAFLPFSVFRLALGIATAVLTFRLATRGTLVSAQDGIRWHTVMRTSHWRYSAIDHFELAVRTRASGSQQHMMRIHLRDGRAQWLRALEEPPKVEDEDRSIPSRPDLPGSRLPWYRRPPPNLSEVVAQLNRILTQVHDVEDQREAG